jgi:RNA polymerase sigma-70 factor, ECF subfamily
MRWSLRSVRLATDLPPNGQPVLRPIPGLGGAESSGRGFGKFSLSRDDGKGSSPGSATDLQPRHYQSNTDPGAGPGSHSSGSSPKTLQGIADPGSSSPQNAQESAHRAQPSGADGVREDMATLVLDNSAMGAGSASRPGARPDPDPSVDVVAGTAALDPASDAAVMLRVAAGDEDGFNYLVGKYHRAMIHFLFRMVRNQAVAEELAQEVFLRVYRSRESYRAEAKFTTWLYRIATNLAVNHARDTKHERSAQTIYLDAPDEESGTTPDVADAEPSVEQKLMRDERMGAIRKHVMELPERQRMAVLMHKYQGMDYRQIGDVLKLSESATKSLLFRAYQTLRDKLKEFV